MIIEHSEEFKFKMIRFLSSGKNYVSHGTHNTPAEFNFSDILTDYHLLI